MLREWEEPNILRAINGSSAPVTRDTPKGHQEEVEGQGRILRPREGAMGEKSQQGKIHPKSCKDPNGSPRPAKNKRDPKAHKNPSGSQKLPRPSEQRIPPPCCKLLSFAFHLQKELQNLLQTAVANPPHVHKCPKQPQALDCTSMGAVGMGSMAQSHCNTPKSIKLAFSPLYEFISPHWG